jgi:hypothetical protein
MNTDQHKQKSESVTKRKEKLDEELKLVQKQLYDLEESYIGMRLSHCIGDINFVIMLLATELMYVHLLFGMFVACNAIMFLSCTISCCYVFLINVSQRIPLRMVMSSKDGKDFLW